MATSSTFSGAFTASAGTLSALIDRCQVFLNDESDSTWDTEMIGTFLNDAIRDYSQHFPRVRTAAIDLSTGSNAYNLPEDILGIVSVEYPAGEDPPQYLRRKDYTAVCFWSDEQLYDIVRNRDDANVDELWLSADPNTGETAIIYYNAYHQLIADPSTPGGSNTVPEEHQQLLVKYVNWQASLHLAFAEQQFPTSNSSLLMAQLAQNARRNELSYHTALQQAIYAAEGLSKYTHWATSGSGVGRIY